MIFKIVMFLLIVSSLGEMDKAKENKDLCGIAYWGVLFISLIFMACVCR